MGKITSADVAREAGVSQSTVSRVYSAGHLVSESTRRQVTEVADRLGYRFDPSGRALRTGRRGTVGVLVPDVSNPYFSQIVKCIQEVVVASGRQVVLAETGEDPQSEHEIAHAVAQYCDGLIACAPRSSADQLRSLDTPLVVACRVVPRLAYVAVDEATGMRDALDHLAGLGHLRIAVLGGPARSASQRARAAASRKWATTTGPELIMIGGHPPTTGGGLAAVDEVVDSRVTAVVAFNDRTALGLLAGLAARGVEVPAAMSIISWDDTDLALAAIPPLTTVHMPLVQLGRQAAERLLAALGEGPEPSGPSELPTSLIIRGSTAPPRTRGAVRPVTRVDAPRKPRTRKRADR